MKSNEKIFWDLFNANSELEVSGVIKKHAELQNQKNWLPYGGNRGNFGTFESQQNHPVPALIEKITNSIDATLIKEAKIRGIDPKGKSAPKTMDKAVEDFYGIKDGEIGTLSANARRILAENIQIIAVGDKRKPSMVIYDNGEGQHPSNFKNTFLSLHQNNKTNIHFVQGKYNMGSTGAVVFCGDKKFQLIASKRNSLLSEGGSNFFGYTLVRRHELTPTEELDYGKATWYEYFTLAGEIASFPIKEIDLGLYGRKFTSGSIIKLYDYELPKGSRSAITLDLWRDLNQYMFHLPLPVILYEKRDYTSNSPTKPVLGNKTRITIDGRESVSNVISFKLSKELGMGEIPIDVIIFKSSVDHGEFIKNKSIIFTQNGQVHGFEGQSFISQDLGFSLLKKHALIHVNCTDIPTNIRQDLFMANRTHLKNGHKSEDLRAEIVKLLRKSEELKRINNLIKNSLLQDSEGDKDLLENLLSKLPVDKDVIDLLKKNGSLNFLKQSGNKVKSGDTKSEVKKLNRFPSIFTLNLNKKGNDNKKIYKTIPLNSKGTVIIDTDVQNDYFFGARDAGKLEIQVLRKLNITDEPISDVTQPNEYATAPSDILSVSVEGLSEGRIKLIINPTEKAKVGDEVEVLATLTDTGGKKFQCMFDVKVDEQISKPKQTEKAPTETFPTLPTPRKAYEATEDENSLLWNSPELNWTGHDIVKIITSSDKSELMVSGIIVNMDSFVLKNFISKNRLTTEKEIKFNKDKYFMSIYFHSLFLFSILQKMRSGDERLKSIEVDEFVSLMIKPYANFLMYENHHITKMAFNE